MQYLSNNPQQTKAIAIKIAQKFKNGGIIALHGELGAGKTIFTQGFAEALKISNKITSPTFMLMREYMIPQNFQGKFYHLDLYRLSAPIDIQNLGLNEILANPHNIVIIEWAEKINKELPKHTSININKKEENSRVIDIKTIA